MKRNNTISRSPKLEIFATPSRSEVGTGGKNSLSSFTLVELMVVIAVIAILLGLIIPTYSGIREQARKTKARTTAKYLETGFREYYNYYRKWPSADSGPLAITGTLYQIMQGNNIGGMNPGERAFIEFEVIRGSNAPTESACDPWKYNLFGNESWQAYRVQFDQDFNNQIDYDGAIVYRSVLVWSPGPDRADYTDDDIRSWE